MKEHRTSVLLIEEEPTLREITAFRLELLGYEVTAVESAENGLNLLQKDMPQAIIVGHFLPGMSGFDLINKLSNDVQTSKTPVLFLSPNSDLECVQQAYTAGAKDYLVAPYDPLVLQSKVLRLTSLVLA